MQLTKKKQKPIGYKSDLTFYLLILLFPIVQFCIFYIYVNFNSFFLAFKDIKMISDASGYRYISEWSTKGIVDAWELISKPVILNAAKSSLIFYGFGLVIGMPAGLFFSYYIAKKHAGAGFFRVILYLPSILSSIVMVTLYTYFINIALPDLIEDITGQEEVMGLMNRPVIWQYGVVIFFNIWTGFGVNVLMYANAMSGIDPEITEAAYLDGATGVKEFWHISLPLVYPTLSVFVITGVAAIFTNQNNLFSFYGDTLDPPIESFGYYLFAAVNKYKTDQSHFPYLSAFGLMMSAVAIPLTFIVKHLLEKYGPSED